MSMQTPPRLDTPQAAMALGQYRRWVGTGVVLLLAGYASSIGARLVSVRPLVAGAYMSETVVVAVLLVALGLLPVGRVRAAAFLALAAFWVELHVGGPMQDGGLAGTGTAALPAVIVAMGLFFGGRSAIAAALVTAVSFPATAQVGAALGRGPGIENAVSVVTLAIVLVGTALVVQMGLRAYGAMLRTSQANERKFSLLVRHAPEGIVLLDDTGRVGSLNPAAERMLDVRELDALGRPFVELVRRLDPTAPSAADLLGRRGLPQELTLHHGAGRTVRAECTTIETVRADGSRGLQLTLVDVTARRDAEERAVRLGEMIDRSPSEIYVIDPETLALRLMNLGARRSVGYDAEELAGLSMDAVNPMLAPARIQTLAKEQRSSPEGISHRGVHRRKDGSAYPVEFQLHDATFGGGPVLVVFALDIADRVAAEEEQEQLRGQLQQAQKMEAVGQLAGGVAHDFNNLLMAIGGYAEMVEQFADEPRIKKWAGEIRRSQERGAGLTRKLLSFARREVTQPQVLSLSEVLNDVRPILERMLGERIALRMESAGGDYVVADASQLEQMIVHLVSNARDAMPHGGTVSLLVRPDEEPAGRRSASRRRWVVLEINDDGIGMNEPTRHRIFDQFFTTKPRGKGTGLGLATVHSIVVQNGGRVEVRSEPGVGTTFEVWWPAADRPAASPPAGRRTTPTESERPGTVLVVEDDESTRGLVSIFLTQAGHVVAAAASAEEGQELLDDLAGKVDVLLTDVVLPGRSGFDLAHYVRDTYPAVKILFMSGSLNDLLPDSGEFDTAADLLLKPFAKSDLLRRVGEALRGSKR